MDYGLIQEIRICGRPPTYLSNPVTYNRAGLRSLYLDQSSSLASVNGFFSTFVALLQLSESPGLLPLINFAIIHLTSWFDSGPHNKLPSLQPVAARRFIVNQNRFPPTRDALAPCCGNRSTFSLSLFVSPRPRPPDPSAELSEPPLFLHLLHSPVFKPVMSPTKRPKVLASWFSGFPCTPSGAVSPSLPHSRSCRNLS